MADPLAEEAKRTMDRAVELANRKDYAHGSVYHAVVDARDAMRGLVERLERLEQLIERYDHSGEPCEGMCVPDRNHVVADLRAVLSPPDPPTTGGNDAELVVHQGADRMADRKALSRDGGDVADPPAPPAEGSEALNTGEPQGSPPKEVSG